MSRAATDQEADPGGCSKHRSVLPESHGSRDTLAFLRQSCMVLLQQLLQSAVVLLVTLQSFFSGLIAFNFQVAFSLFPKCIHGLSETPGEI